jgi:hypothetical protein
MSSGRRLQGGTDTAAAAVQRGRRPPTFRRVPTTSGTRAEPPRPLVLLSGRLRSARGERAEQREVGEPRRLRAASLLRSARRSKPSDDHAERRGPFATAAGPGDAYGGALAAALGLRWARG